MAEANARLQVSKLSDISILIPGLDWHDPCEVDRIRQRSGHMGEIAHEHGRELGFASIDQNLDGDRLFGNEPHHFGYQGGQVSTQHI